MWDRGNTVEAFAAAVSVSGLHDAAPLRFPPHVAGRKDGRGLLSEPAGGSNISGLDDEAIEFLATDRVELNAMTSREFVDFVESKLDGPESRKVVPDFHVVKAAFAQGSAASNGVRGIKEGSR